MYQVVDQSDLLLERLLVAIGKGGAAEVERTNLTSWFRSIKTGYRIQAGRVTSISHGREVFNSRRETLQNLRDLLVEAGELRKQLGERKEDIQKAGAVCVAEAKQLPMDQFKRRVALSDPKLVDEVAATEIENIQYLLDTDAANSKKGLTRRLLIEPFFHILHRHDVVWSRKLPLTGMMEALFDFVGIEPNRRPTETGIRTIAADMGRELKDTPRSWR